MCGQSASFASRISTTTTNRRQAQGSAVRVGGGIMLGRAPPELRDALHAIDLHVRGYVHDARLGKAA